MARIRTLKPEFWDSPSTAQADLAVRLTFMALWNWSDDSGRGTANVKELEAFAFPNDEITQLPRRSSGNSAGVSGTWRNFSEILGEVAEAYGVVFYRVDGRPYFWIPSFSKHQSRDFREKSRYPFLEEGEMFDVTTGNTINEHPSTPPANPPENSTSADISGSSADTSGEAGLGIGEQGNRGIGDLNPPTPPGGGNERGDDQQQLVEVDQPAPPAPKRKTKPAANEHNTDPEFAKFWEVYPLKKSKKAAHSAYRKALEIVDLETLIAGAASYRDDPSRNPDKTKHPSTWLNQHCWEDEPGPAAPPANWIPNQYPAMSASDRRLAEVQEREQQILAGEYQHLTENQPYAPLRAVEGGNYLG